MLGRCWVGWVVGLGVGWVFIIVFFQFLVFSSVFFLGRMFFCCSIFHLDCILVFAAFFVFVVPETQN